MTESTSPAEIATAFLDEQRRQRDEHLRAALLMCSTLGYQGPELMNKYRPHSGEAPPFDWREAEAAVLYALNVEGGISAWSGDGVAIVVQMIEAQARRVRFLEEKLAEVLTADLVAPEPARGSST